MSHDELLDLVLDFVDRSDHGDGQPRGKLILTVDNINSSGHSNDRIWLGRKGECIDFWVYRGSQLLVTTSMILGNRWCAPNCIDHLDCG